MAVIINGNGTISGLSVGGLPNGVIDTDTLADNAVTKAKRTHQTGEIVQTQAFLFTAITESFTTRGWHATSVTKQITPTSASNKILVMATLTAGNSAVGEGAAFKVMRSVNGAAYVESDALADDVGGGGNRGAVGGLYDDNVTYNTDCRSIQFLDNPATTQAIDYKIYVYLFDNGSHNCRVNRPETSTAMEHVSGTSSIVLMEIAS
tara:strand:- start:54 stop:671 length:618 start_codon:yes stop_codon:yes gene_type:complete